jgi:large subunit ribosomal protein L19
MSSVIDSIERRQERQGLPSFAPGDRVRVHFQVVEGSRRRTQVFEGIVIKRQGSGARETFTVRKQSFGVGVERTFPMHSRRRAPRQALRPARPDRLGGASGRAALGDRR